MARWWLTSWTTHGTWLPGDERGYRTWRGRNYAAPPKRYAKPGESAYKASKHTSVLRLAKSICHEPVHLKREQMQVALAAMVGEIAEIPVVPAIMSGGESHVHWLCYFGPLEIRSTISRVKSAASRELNSHGFNRNKPWTKGCNTRSKATQHEFRTAYRYIRDHREQGCLIFEWPINSLNLVIE